MLKINKHTIKSNKINSTLKIILIADIHIWENYKDNLLEYIINKLTEIKPNIICLCGDIIDEYRYLEKKENEEYLLNFLNSLANICTTFISLGSHDFLNSKKLKTNSFSYQAIRYWQKMIKNNANPNLILLHNCAYETNDLRIIGYTPSKKYYGCTESSKVLIKELNKTFEYKYNDNKYTILMCHSPQRINKELLKNLKMNQNIDIILSGHMHDGLVFPIFKKLPTTIGLVSPQRKFFPKNTRGTKRFIINNHNIFLIITGGLIKFSHMSPKIFHRFNFLYNSDIESITIKKC